MTKVKCVHRSYRRQLYRSTPHVLNLYLKLSLRIYFRDRSILSTTLLHSKIAFIILGRSKPTALLENDVTEAL